MNLSPLAMKYLSSMTEGDAKKELEECVFKLGNTLDEMFDILIEECERHPNPRGIEVGQELRVNRKDCLSYMAAKIGLM